jgi:hypothetical protein
MNLVSLNAYAKQHGASAQAATKWKTKGHLVLQGDKVDVNASDERLRAAGLGRFGARAGAPQTPRSPAPAATAKAPVEDVVQALVEKGVAADESGLRKFIEGLLGGETKTHASAAAIKENALALKHALEALKIAGSLVDADIAEKVLFEVSRSARDLWLNFPSKYGPKLAADLKLEPGPVVEALTAHVHRQIEELGEPVADFSGEPG